MGESIKLLTYNIKMLSDICEWVSGSNKDKKRVKDIVKYFLDQNEKYDIICLQEIFDEGIREYLKKKLKPKYKYIKAKCDDGDWFHDDSGLFFASKIRKTSPYMYEEFNSKTGWDALSDKGIFGVKLNFNGKILYVFNTHLQADKKNSKIRLKQIKQIKNFICKKIKTHTPRELIPMTSIILVGDFNVIGDSSEEYKSMIKYLGNPVDIYRKLKTTDGFTWDGPNNTMCKTKSKRERLDYIFTYNALNFIKGEDGSVNLNKIDPQQIKLIKLKNSNNKDLSDHYGLSFEFQV